MRIHSSIMNCIVIFISALALSNAFCSPFCQPRLISVHHSQNFITSTTKLNYAQTSTPDSSDPYVILDLDPKSVDISSIKNAYRKMAMKYHPDATIGIHKSNEEKDQSNKEFVRVNAAYAFLIGKSDQMPEAGHTHHSNSSHLKKESQNKQNHHQQPHREDVRPRNVSWQYRPYRQDITFDGSHTRSHQSTKSTSSTFSTAEKTTTRRVRVHESQSEKRYQSSTLHSSRTYDGLCIKVQNQLRDLQLQRDEYHRNQAWQQKY